MKIFPKVKELLPRYKGNGIASQSHKKNRREKTECSNYPYPLSLLASEDKKDAPLDFLKVLLVHVHKTNTCQRNGGGIGFLEFTSLSTMYQLY